MRKTLATICVLLLCASSTARADLVAHFPFDGDTLDATANGNDGTFVGGKAPTYVEGFDGADPGAIDFDGVDDYVNVAQTAGLPITDHPAFSIAMWVRGAQQADKRVFSEGSSTSNTPLFNLGTPPGNNAGPEVNSFLRPGPAHRKGTIPAFDGEWHHIAWVDDGGCVRVYVDGVRDPRDFNYARQLAGLDRTSIGAILRGGPCCWFDGAIDDVRLYDHALTATELRELVEDVDCPEDGDTHCGEIEVVDTPFAGGPGTYTVAVSGRDDSEDPIFFDVAAYNEAGVAVSCASGEGPEFALALTEGVWTIIATVDDDFRCLDEAEDNRCRLEVEVGASDPICVSHWALDGDLTDSGPGGNDGSWIDPDASGENYVTGFDGTPNGALSFDGVDDLARFAHNNGLPIYHNPAYTVSMWVRGVGTGQNDRRVFSEGSTTDGNPLLNLGTHNTGADGTLDIFIRRGGTLVGHAHSGLNAFDGDWHHVTFIDDNGNCSIYIDGVLDGVMPAYTRQPIVPMNTTTIGGILRNVASFWFEGAIDEVRVYNYALGEDEIIELVPEPEDCDGEADTTCTGIDVEAPEGELAGPWTFTASADDASGDESFIYTFELFDGEGALVRRVGPQTGASMTANLTAGDWTVAVCVDDSLRCRDEGGDECCRTEVTVRAVPAVKVSSWTFNGTLEDSENSNHGAWNGDEDPVFVQGWDCEPGGALSFSGDSGNNPGDDVVIVEQNDFLPLYNGGEFTIAMWVKGPPQRDKRVWSEGNGSGNNSPLFNIGTGSTAATEAKLDFYLRDNGGSAAQGNHVKSAADVFDDTWHHICWVDDNGDVTLYIDGVEDNGETGAGFDYTRPTLTLDTTTIGGILRGSTCCEFTGRIDDVMIWNYAISEEEVLEICGQDAPECCPEEGDTHCEGLTAEPLPLPDGGAAGDTVLYEVIAAAIDDSGDDIFYLFEATAEGQKPVDLIRTLSNRITMELVIGATYTIVVTVDDDPECEDMADDASCRVEVTVEEPCPPVGDTRCESLDVSGDGTPGEYTATATAVDDSGDAVIYTFTATHPTVDPPTVIGPQAENVAVFNLLVEGDWLITVEVDDDPDCEDVDENASCSAEVTVNEGVGPFKRGDVNDDSATELTDAVAVFNWLFLGGVEPTCMAAANPNDQELIDLTSGVYLLNWLFLGGPDPLAPLGECGFSTLANDVALGCDSYTSCP